MTEEPDEEGRLLPAEIVHGDGLDVIAGRLVEAARADGVALTGEGGLLPALLSRVLSAGLEAELGEHLGYDRHAPAGRNSGNSRNGAYQRTVTTEVGPVEVTMPRDRNSSFDPKLVPKGERRMDGLSRARSSRSTRRGSRPARSATTSTTSTAPRSRKTRSLGSPIRSWPTWSSGNHGRSTRCIRSC